MFLIRLVDHGRLSQFFCAFYGIHNLNGKVFGLAMSAPSYFLYYCFHYDEYLPKDQKCYLVKFCLANVP